MTVEFRSRRAATERQRQLVEEARLARDERERVVVAALEAGVACRAAQRAYFAKRTTTNLIAAKEAEGRFDRLAEDVMASIPARHPATSIGE